MFTLLYFTLLIPYWSTKRQSKERLARLTGNEKLTRGSIVVRKGILYSRSSTPQDFHLHVRYGLISLQLHG